MAPFFPAAAFLAHMFSPRGPPHDHGLLPEQRDPEKGGSGDGQEHDYGDDPEEVEDFEDYEEHHEGANEGQEVQDEPQSRRGVPLTSTGTMSSTSMINYRPSVPQCFVKTKEILFGSHNDNDNEVVLPDYRRTPIISGSLIPFSILLEIPGLTESWYVRTYNHQTVETRKNPPLVVASISISMALAVLANVALISRFLDRHVKRNTIICIAALTVHGNIFFLCF
jgi:potassium channel subfamily K, other eukaryote